MFFKIVRNFKAKIGPFLLTLFLAPGYVYANTWEINVTRKDSNLYQITGKDSFVNTKYCYVYAFSEDAYLRVDGYDKKIIFTDSKDSCDVDNVFSMVNIDSGKYEVEVSKKEDNLFCCSSERFFFSIKSTTMFFRSKRNSATFSGIGIRLPEFHVLPLD